MAKLSVLVPVYNEADNLMTLQDSLATVLVGLGHDWEAVLANDGSTDGSTGVSTRLRRTIHDSRWFICAETSAKPPR